MVKLRSDNGLTPPFVSVVLPTYNRRALVVEAIESVLSQDYYPFELIVVDDGSSDGTEELLAGYGKRLRPVRQENRGVSAARNTGIGAARGELIALIDSDDTWLPGKLSAQVAFFLAHPGMMICQTEELWVRNGRRVNPKNRHQKYGGWIFEKTLPLCLISPSAVMMRRTLLDDVGLFDESLPACEDYDLWLRVTCRYPVGLIGRPYIVKRGGHADQLSRMDELDKHRIRALIKILDSGHLSAGQRSAALSMLRAKAQIYGEGCRKRGRMEEAHFYSGLSRTEEIDRSDMPMP